MRVMIYKAANGKEPLTEWLNHLKDHATQIRIRQRLRRLEIGQMGDCQSVGQGVHELRFFFGKGYRVYFSMEGKTLIMLLCGGDKSSQSRDIKKAKAYWKEYQEHAS